MKDTFGHLRNILQNKEQYTIKDGEDFVPFMIQRWCSMVSPELCFILNETINTHASAMEDKQMWHDGFLAMVPAVGYKRISYMKKAKKEHADDVKLLARRLEISCREAAVMVELDKDMNKKEKSVEVSRKRS
jgi:hypothetical protein|tara:strand:+ start:8886 stop:9281 length:396 start_codon:yes stop_codon:yes gene_type:complete